MSNFELVNDFIFTTNIIPKDVCDGFIFKMKDRKEWKTHDWTREDQGDLPLPQGGGTPSWLPSYEDEPHPNDPHGERECDVLYGNHVQGLSILNKYLKKALDQYAVIHNNSQSNVSTVVSPKFNRYKKGCQMQPHVDHIKSLFDGKYRGVPVLSIIGLIGDAFDGGEFYCRGKEIPLNKGDILIFPSCFLYSHEVKKVKSGVRYTFVSWAF